jgi:hypothetical protein
MSNLTNLIVTFEGKDIAERAKLRLVGPTNAGHVIAPASYDSFSISENPQGGYYATFQVPERIYDNPSRWALFVYDKDNAMNFGETEVDVPSRAQLVAKVAAEAAAKAQAEAAQKTAYVATVNAVVTPEIQTQVELASKAQFSSAADALQTARGEVQTVAAEYDALKTSLETTKNDLETAKDAYKTATTDYEALKAGFDAAKTDFETAKGTFQTATAEFGTAKTALESSIADLRTARDKFEAAIKVELRQPIPFKLNAEEITRIDSILFKKDLSAKDPHNAPKELYLTLFEWKSTVDLKRPHFELTDDQGRTFRARVSTPQLDTRSGDLHTIEFFLHDDLQTLRDKKRAVLGSWELKVTDLGR